MNVHNKTGSWDSLYGKGTAMGCRKRLENKISIDTVGKDNKKQRKFAELKLMKSMYLNVSVRVKWEMMSGGIIIITIGTSPS